MGFIYQWATRFGALRRQVEGISSRVLTERLRVLEQKGFVYRDYEPTISPSVTYGITKRMKDIERVLEDLQRLALKWQEEEPPAAPGGVKKRAMKCQFLHTNSFALFFLDKSGIPAKVRPIALCEQVVKGCP